VTTALDLKLVPKAQALLTKFGLSVTYNKATAGTYNPALGSVSGGTSAAHTVKISPPEPIRDDLLGLHGNDTYKSGDLTTYLADEDLSFEPAAGGNDTIVIAGVTYNVIGVHAYYSGDLIAIWRLNLRKN
jgi:hypothetical protein